jgi:hypothetical protein
LAKAFTKSDGKEGKKGEEASNKAIISKLPSYKEAIQPLMQGKPPVDGPVVDCARVDKTLRNAGL